MEPNTKIVVTAIREGLMYWEGEMIFGDLIALDLRYKIDPSIKFFTFLFNLLLYL